MKVVILGGSLRVDSLNRKLMAYLGRELEAQGHQVQRFEGDALRVPFYEDHADTPAPMLALHEALMGAQAMVLVSPEYNQGMPSHLKNALDWVSVQKVSAFAGLPVLLAAASPGAFGGARGMVGARATLANLGAVAFGEAIPVPLADKNLEADGTPVEARTRELLPQVLGRFAAFADKVQAHA